VPTLEFWALLGSLAVFATLSIWAHFKITQIAASQLGVRIEELNEALGEAIQLVSSGGLQTEQNPLMHVFAQLLQNKAQEPISAKIVEQDAGSGKFVKKIE